MSFIRLGAPIVAVACVCLVSSASAETTRSAYVDQADPICTTSAHQFGRLLIREDFIARIPIHPPPNFAAIQKKREHKFGRRYLRVGRSFGTMVSQLAAVPAPAEDAPTISTWLGRLSAVRKSLASRGHLLLSNQDGKFFKRTGVYLGRVDLSTQTVAGFGFNYCAFSTTEVPWWDPSRP
jgi:hypothetical protein